MIAIASTIISFPLTAQGEEIKDLRQLMSSNECVGCDLTYSGLVRADLTGADLRNADLTRANLSRANLSRANLSGANLSGVSLNGANLNGANLSGADLTGADLRNAYLMNTNLRGVDLNTVYIQGALGVPSYAGTSEQFQRWAILEFNRGHYQAASNYYNQALNIDPYYAPAYLGRAALRYQIQDFDGAMKDAQTASQLFERQENTQGYQASQDFIEGLEFALNPESEGGGGFGGVLNSIGSLLLQFLF